MGTSSINGGFSIVIVDYNSKVSSFFSMAPLAPQTKGASFSSVEARLPGLIGLGKGWGFCSHFHESHPEVPCFYPDFISMDSMFPNFVCAPNLIKNMDQFYSISMIMLPFYWLHSFFLEPCPFQDPLGPTGLFSPD